MAVATAKPDPTEAKIGRVLVDFELRELVDGRRREALTRIESNILRVLARRRGSAVPRMDIFVEVYGCDPNDTPNSRTVDQHIARIRQKLGRARDQVVTIKQRGYALRK